MISMTHDHEWRSLGARHDWCWVCGCLKSYRYRRDYVRKPFKVNCFGKHKWKGHWGFRKAEEHNYWDHDHEWCKDCGAIKHKGATYELMAMGRRKIKSQIILVGSNKMKNGYSVFGSLGLMHYKIYGG